MSSSIESPCSECSRVIFNLSPGEEGECSNCGQEWVADSQGVWRKRWE